VGHAAWPGPAAARGRQAVRRVEDEASVGLAGIGPEPLSGCILAFLQRATAAWASTAACSLSRAGHSLDVSDPLILRYLEMALGRGLALPSASPLEETPTALDLD